MDASARVALSSKWSACDAQGMRTMIHVHACDRSNSNDFEAATPQHSWAGSAVQGDHQVVARRVRKGQYNLQQEGALKQRPQPQHDYVFIKTAMTTTITTNTNPQTTIASPQTTTQQCLAYGANTSMTTEPRPSKATATRHFGELATGQSTQTKKTRPPKSKRPVTLDANARATRSLHRPSTFASDAQRWKKPAATREHAGADAALDAERNDEDLQTAPRLLNFQNETRKEQLDEDTTSQPARG